MLVEVLAHIGHGGVGDLHGVSIDHLPQFMVWRKTGVEEGKELLPDVGGDGLGVGGVEPSHFPRPRPGVGSGGSRLLVDQLVVVASLVQGLLVRCHHSQELLLTAGEPAEPSVYLQGDVLEDAGGVVGQVVDVEDGGVWLGVSSVRPSCQIEGYIKKIYYFLVCLTGHLQTVVLVHLLDLLPKLLGQPGSQCTGS